MSRENIDKLNDGNVELIGTSHFCRTIREQIPVIANFKWPILILGQSGTGKEVIARMIHAASKRADQPYLSINCATLGNLAESELFGHVHGAFTGAVRGTNGYIGSANGGTLFLDEVGELPLNVQAKLLRFLDHGEYFRVGDAAPKSSDVRIIAATNQNLEKMCREKLFREDLYYRLSGFEIRTVPLSKRIEDIPLLVRYFIRTYAKEYGTEEPSISPDVIDVLTSQTWPGNVRQLKHVVFKLCHLAMGKTITSDLLNKWGVLSSPDTHLRIEVKTSPSDSELEQYNLAKKKAIEEFDHKYFSKLLETTKGNLKDSLTISGLHKKNFYLKLKKIGIKANDFRIRRRNNISRK